VIDDPLREELSALVDGALPEERAKELRRLIREDKELSREYAELENAALAVRGLPRAGAPAELRARIGKALDTPRARGGGRLLRLGMVAAAATVLVAAGLAFHLHGRGAPQHLEAKDQGAPAEELARNAEKSDDRLLPRGPADGAKQESTFGAPAAHDEMATDEPKPGKAERGAPRRQQETGVLAAVVKSKSIPVAERKEYLRELAALAPDKVQEHLLALLGPETERDFLPQASGGAPPLLATVLLEDREEAKLVSKILGEPPAAEAAEAPAVAGSAAALTVETEKKGEMSTEVRGSATDLQRLGRWLDLLDLSRGGVPRPKVTVVQERKAAAKEEEPPVRTVIVRLKFGKPAPKPPETPEAPKGK
jgi:hypothetical protein